MDEPIKTQLQDACRRLMRPIATLLLHCGMTWREFSELSKSIFVDVASSDFASDGGTTNVSRVSILTGISRKEVSRQRKLLERQQEPLPNKTTDATRVLSGWHQDPEFVDRDGRPRVLPLQGDTGSFASLMRGYGGDIPPAAMLKALKTAKAVAQDDAGELEVLTRFYMPVQLDTELIPLAGDIIHELAATLNHNLTRQSEVPSRFQGRATDNRVDRDAIPAFRELLEREGQAFLERIDDWLNEHRIADGDRTLPSVRLGVGLYAIQETIDQTGPGTR